MKYSIILPSHDPELKNHQMFMAMLQSIDLHSKGRDYELIIRKNGRSYTESFNDALISARGEYIISCQDDMVIEDDQWLEKLTDDNYFVTTKMNKFHLDGSDCPYWALFGMSRKIYREIGLLDYSFKNGICFEDNDYIFRMREAGISFKVVDLKFQHLGGVSTGLYLKEDKSGMEYKNHKIFCEKWRHRLKLQ